MATVRPDPRPPITLAGQAMLPASGLFPSDVCGLPHGQFLKRWDLLQTQTQPFNVDDLWGTCFSLGLTLPNLPFLVLF